MKPSRPSLLDPSGPPPYEVHRAAATAPQLVVCDHAGCAIPPALNNLGLAPEHRASHIAQDLGARELALALSERLHATAVLCNYSRLVVDCNRALTDSSTFLDASGGVEVPGNGELSAADRELRAAAIYHPYHGAIDRELDRLCSFAAAPVLIAIHSFTRFLEGEDRRWDMGVLWDLDARIARPLIDALRDSGRLLVGDNQPYSGRHPEDFTVDHHAEARGFACAALEIRQDLLDSPAAVARMADAIHQALGPILSDPDLYTPRS